MAKDTQKLPDWKDAPSWAMYRAVDQDGELCYYINKPVMVGECWDIEDCGQPFERVGKFNHTDWKNSLERRPEPQTQDKEPVTWEWLESVGFEKVLFGHSFRGVNGIDVYISNGISNDFRCIDIVKGCNNITVTAASGEELTREKVQSIISVFT